MTDRIHSLTVVLLHDMRDDDCEQFVSAISLMKGVASVKLNVADSEHCAAEVRVAREMRWILLRLATELGAQDGLDRVTRALRGLRDA